MFWSNFARLCDAVGKKPNVIAKDLGLSSGSLTAWKQGVIPRATTISKIADYFGITTSELLGEETAAHPTAEAELTPKQQEAWDIIREMDDGALEKFINVAKAMLGIKN